jgi:UDP-3-O-[3-hydroxymyristoyl] N-acetylglucosamine deacetylase
MGNSIIGEFDAHKSGHGLNNASVLALIADEDAWEMVTFVENANEAPISYNS